MAEVAKAIGRPPTYPTKYFGCELGAQTLFDFKVSYSKPTETCQTNFFFIPKEWAFYRKRLARRRQIARPSGRFHP